MILSSFIGSVLLETDARAGGLDVEWRIALPDGFSKTMASPDGSLIVVGDKGIIQDIDRNGTVDWVYYAVNSSDMSMGLDGKLYYIETMDDGNYSVNCLFSNGTMNWRFETDKTIIDIQIGADGNIYFFENPNFESILVCLTPDGLVKWVYTPPGGDNSQYPIAVFEDGTVLVRNPIVTWGVDLAHPEGAWIATTDDLVSISSDGLVQWKKDIIQDTADSTQCEGPMITGNGTILLILVENRTQTALGLDRNGSVKWESENHNFAFPRESGPGNVVYYVENFEDQPWGYPSNSAGQISCWNTSSGALVWQQVFDGWVYGPVQMSENASWFFVDGELAKFSSNGSLEWAVGSHYDDLISYDNGSGGLLIGQGSTLSKIDEDGLTLWEFGIESSIKAIYPGTGDSDIVFTDDYAISIHKPVLTTTMNYFVVLLAIDLFVMLMSLVWIIDRLWPQNKAHSE